MYLEALNKIFRITLTLLLIVILPVVVFTLVSSKIPVYGIKSFVVLTGSMEPAVPVGSVIYTLKSASYKVGDIIAFKQGDLTITHRIIQVTPGGYITQGDANNAVDSKVVPASEILGVKTYMLLNLGKLILALKTIPGFIAFIVIPAALLIGFEIRNIKKEFEKEIRKKILAQM